MKDEDIIDEINITAFISVLLAGLLLGFIAHELFHFLTIANVSSITINFGNTKAALSTCCLSADENAMEEFAYTVQFIVTIGWVILNSGVFLRTEKHSRR